MQSFTAELPILTERARKLLKALVELYIRDGKPVGSRMLAREAGLDLSPATVRNEVADLEELGLVTSPHTSAGRIPTVKGYRLFVDHLMTVVPLPGDQIQRLKARLDPDQNIDALLLAASGLLSRSTHFAGLAMWPRRDILTLRHVEFLPLSDERVLVILVLNEREVESKVIQTRRKYSAGELQQATNFLNEIYGGQDLFAIRERLLRELADTSDRMDRIVRAAVEMAEQALAPAIREHDYVVAGETNLLEFVRQDNMDKLRQLFEAFSRKRDIVHLLDACLATRGIRVVIGEESGVRVLDEYSVVASPYGVAGQVVGLVAVIGPTRMPYEKVIPIVNTTAELLGEALNFHQ